MSSYHDDKDNMSLHITSSYLKYLQNHNLGRSWSGDEVSNLKEAAFRMVGPKFHQIRWFVHQTWRMGGCSIYLYLHLWMIFWLKNVEECWRSYGLWIAMKVIASVSFDAEVDHGSSDLYWNRIPGNPRVYHHVQYQKWPSSNAPKSIFHCLNIAEVSTIRWSNPNHSPIFGHFFGLDCQLLTSPNSPFFHGFHGFHGERNHGIFRPPENAEFFEPRAVHHFGSLGQAEGPSAWTNVRKGSPVGDPKVGRDLNTMEK